MIWFSSDPHYWHRNVIEFCKRPFADVEQMNRGLIDNWNAVVGQTDKAFILGDFAFCGSTEIQKIVPRLNGEKHLILGNHDWKYKPVRWLQFGFADVKESGFVEANVPGGMLALSHFPYFGGGDHVENERYSDKRLHDNGHWLLHGHVHQGWKKKRNMINVGVDVWNYTPVALPEIERLCNES